jgi:hypothetical protein
MTAPVPDTITETTLKALLAGGGRGVRIRAGIAGLAEGGFAVVVRIGVNDVRRLVTTRGTERRFASLDTAAGQLKDLGLPVFFVDVSNYKAARFRPPRPDRAVALRATRTRPLQQTLV